MDDRQPPEPALNLADAAEEGLLLVDDSDVIVGHNSAAHRLVGGAALQGQTLSTLLEVTSGGADPVARRDGVCRRHNGLSIPVHVWERRSQGARVFVLRDATDWHGAQSTLALIATAVEHASDAFEVTDASGRIEYANGAHETLTGYPLFEVLGEKLTRFVEESPTVLDRIERAFSEGLPWRGDVRCLRRDGQLRHQELTLAPVIDGRGQVSRFVSVRRDATTRVAAEREVERLREELVHAERLSAIGHLAANVAHEVNNPATFILTNQALLKDELNDLNRDLQALLSAADPHLLSVDVAGRAKAFATRIELMQEMVAASMLGTERIVSLVRDLRNFARVDEARHLERTSLADVVQDAVKIVGPRLRQVAELEVDVRDAPTVVLDRMRIGQVLVNLLVNAMHAMEGGPGRHSLRIAARSEGRFAALRVTDSGAGIAAENVGKVFEPFFTTKARGEGTGLGLAVVRQIVESHGGSVRVESTSPAGTTFLILLPPRTPA